MGKGDKKSRRGKIILGTYGVRRRKKVAEKQVKPSVIDGNEMKEKPVREKKEPAPAREIKAPKEARESKSTRIKGPVENKAARPVMEKPAETKAAKEKKG